MRAIKLLLAMALIIGALAQPSCLLADPLTDHCLDSIDAEKVDQQLAEYLCTIAFERRLYKKAEELCKVAMEGSNDSGYTYFNALLINKKLANALKNEYMLFFVAPFDHNARLASSLAEISPLLAAI